MPAEQPDTPSRIRRLALRVRVPLILALLAGGILLVTVLVNEEDDPTTFRSDEIGRGEALAPGEEPKSYRITYDVHRDGADSRMLLTVRRPFRSRVDDGATGMVRLSRLGTRVLAEPGAVPVTTRGAPQVPSGDVRVLPFLRTAVEAHIAQLGERRRLEELDVECQVYTITFAAVGEEWMLCIDDRGLVVEERGPDGRRTAVEIEIDPDVGNEVFSAQTAPAPPEEGGGAFEKADAGTEVVWVAPEPPPGYGHRGRFTFVTPRDDPHRRRGIVDVWRAGPDFVALEQGRSITGAPAFPAVEPAIEADAGAAGPAQLVLTREGPDLRVDRGDGAYVRVHGTAPPEVLRRFAATIVSAEAVPTTTTPTGQD